MKKLKIAFVYSKRFSFYPPDYGGKGLGGTESTLVLLARALARRGHSVTVFNCCFMPGVYDGVIWKQLWELNPQEEFDAVISLRLLEVFQNDVFKAPLRAVWIHDEALEGASELDEKGIVNMWISVSETQKGFIERKEKINQKNWFVTRNAYNEDIYTDELRKTKKVRNQTIYCSAPDRGLKFLLEMWPAIKKEVPDATLLTTGSYALWGTSDEENKRIFGDIYSSKEHLNGVSFLQRISKNDLATIQAESELMLYPTDFNEMFCISALECLAIGTPIISSKKAALIERVEDDRNGFLVDGNPETDNFKTEFVNKAVAVLKDENLKKELSLSASASVQGLDFENLAVSWETEFLRRLPS
jgi:glycosyltransferase involved in cell wall biosynthesis